RAPEPQHADEPAQRVDEERQAIRGAGFAGAPEARQVERVHRGLATQIVDVVAPRFRESAEAVHEEHRGAAAFHEVVEGETVQRPALELNLRHAATLPETLRRGAGATRRGPG